jgi:hypothetical protein
MEIVNFVAHVLERHYEVLLVQRLKLLLSGERCHRTDVLYGLCGNLTHTHWLDSREEHIDIHCCKFWEL